MFTWNDISPLLIKQTRVWSNFVYFASFDVSGSVTGAGINLRDRSEHTRRPQPPRQQQRATSGAFSRREEDI